MWWHTRKKPDFVFRRNGRVNLNRRRRQFSRLLAAEVCASAVVMLDTPRTFRGTVKCTDYPLHFANFPFTSLPVRHRVSSHFSWSLLTVSLFSKHKWNSCLRYIDTSLSRHMTLKRCCVFSTTDSFVKWTRKWKWTLPKDACYSRPSMGHKGPVY